MKQRIDRILVEKGYFESREQAQRAIMAGEVFADGKRIEKAGQLMDTLTTISLEQTGPKYVSRGAHKLQKALQTFKITVNQRVCLDAGASTGGFTDLMLQSGARLVYAVDVGYGQLAWKLRQDPRVVVFERQNIRYFNPEALTEKPSLITADLSFISLRLLFPKFRELIIPEGELVTLIKPQFEAGKEHVGKKGVVRDRQVHLEVLHNVKKEAAEAGWSLCNLTFSPILGPEGNIEFLGHWQQGGDPGYQQLEQVVDAAWLKLKA